MTPGSAQTARLPLSALLSQALVAFTIEFDNEAERQIQHRTTDHGGTGGVWLVSMAMWLNCMRYAGEEPITVGEMRRLARGGTNLAGMQRWGYITVMPDPADSRPKPPQSDQLVRATGKGLRAKAVWEPLTAEVEQRWRDRYGAAAIARLTEPLTRIASQLGSWLPDCLPILGYGLFSLGPKPGVNRYVELEAEAAVGRPGPRPAGLPLPWLLARVLLAFAIEFELQAHVSLAITANVLRLLDEHGDRVKDLPALSGVSVESLAMATGYLESREMAVVGADPAGGRWKSVRLTPKGNRVRRTHLALIDSVEDGWRERYGAVAVSALRHALEPLASEPLLAAIEPNPDGWRASVRRPATLPHYPMVLHRGGYPDGS
jgi:DNA-binding MarR family transcriptional regulator